MKDYGLILQLISFIDKDIAKYVDDKCKVKKLYIKNKFDLDNFYEFCKRQ